MIPFFITVDSSRASSIGHSPRQSLVAADATAYNQQRQQQRQQQERVTEVITQYDYEQPEVVRVRHTVGCWRRFCRVMKTLCCYTCPVYPVSVLFFYYY